MDIFESRGGDKNMCEYIKIADLAIELGISTQTLKKWEREKKISSYRNFAGIRVYSPAQVEHIKSLLEPRRY